MDSLPKLLGVNENRLDRVQRIDYPVATVSLAIVRSIGSKNYGIEEKNLCDKFSNWGKLEKIKKI